MAKSAEQIREELLRLKADNAKHDLLVPMVADAKLHKSVKPEVEQGGARESTDNERETRMQGSSTLCPLPTEKEREELRSPAQKPSPRRTTGWTAERSQRLQKPDIHQTMPHSVEAKQGVLGSMLCEPRTAIPIAQQAITDRHFHVPMHVTVFNALISMFENEGAVDLITFTQYLRDMGQLDQVGGPSFVTELFTFVPTAANIEYYLDIVKNKYVAREVIAAATESVQRAYEEQDDVPGMFAEHDKRMEAVRVACQVGQARLPALLDASLYLNGNCPPKPAELVKGILHQGSKLVVGGPSKGRKTMALIDLAVSVATGATWWGFPCEQGPVCYINFEIQDAFFWHRVTEVCKAKGVMLERDMFMAWNLRGHGEGIENLIDDLLAVLRHRTFVLDIIDPIYKALGKRDENKAGDVASMLNELEKIAVKTRAAVGFGAHYSKGNQALKESIDRIGGSGVFARDPDSILTMTAHEEPEAFTIEATLRNFAPIKPFVVKWEWPLFSRDESLDPEALKTRRSKVGRPADASENAEELLELLGRGLRYGEFQRAAEQELQMKEKTFEKYFSILKRANRIAKIAGMWTRSGTL